MNRYNKTTVLAACAIAIAALLGSTASAEVTSGGSSTSSTSATSTDKGGCTPATGGDPAKTCTGAGNPLNAATGNKYQREVDMAPLPGVLGLELIRHYNSTYSRVGNVNGIMGSGWKLSYESELETHGNTVQVMQPDGERIIFARTPLDRNLCSTLDPAQGTITVAHTDRGDEYLWRLPSGRQLSFNSKGKLVQIRVLSGEFVSLQHDRQGHLVKVTDPQGRSLELSYLEAKERSNDSAHPRFSGVQHIDTPTGRFSYAYGSAIPQGSKATALDLAANLVRVIRPVSLSMASGATRNYLYEDPRHPTLLTGIEASTSQGGASSASQRVATFAYDERGWAVRSEHGTVVDLLELDRPSPLLGAKPGRAVLVHSKDVQHPQGLALEVLTAQVAGNFRITETRGVACPASLPCPDGNVRYTYDDRGRTRQVTRFAAPQVSRTSAGWQIAALSQPLSADRYEYDALGRTTRHTKVHYGGIGGKQAQARERVVEEFRYDGQSDRVALVRTPSVVGDQWHDVQMAYNEYGQLTKIAEQGWAPPLADRAARPIVRSTSYRYTRLNGRSVLAAIDGPLPGAGDTTHLDWDARGDHVIRVTTPDGLASKVLTRDASGRAERIAQDDGSRYSETFLVFEQGQIVSRTRAAWLRRDGKLDRESRLAETSRYTYDALQRLTAITRADGTQVRTEFGADEKPSRLILPDGGQVALKRNAAGTLIEVSRYDSEQHLLQTVRFEQDAQQRLTGLADNLGQIVSLRYAATHDRPAEVERAGGVKTAYAYDELGFMTEQVQALGTEDERSVRWTHDAAGRVTSIDRGTKQYAVYDDFGRKLAQADKPHGVVLYVWDEASRLIAQVDESKHVQRFEYDGAGRLIASGPDKNPALVRTRYDGRLPSEVVSGDAKIDAGERKLWHYDSLGRLVEERHWLPVAVDTAPSKAAPLLFITTLRYDERGRLAERMLVDAQQRAHRLSYAWDDTTGHLREVTYNGKRVVGDIRATWLAGISDFTHGNGVVEHLERDVRGRLVHHVAQAPQRAVLDDRYTYDGGNRLVAATQTIADRTLQRRYKYDALGRLTAEQTGEAADAFSAYAYDSQNNRTRSTIAGQTQRYAYADQRLLAVEATANRAGWASVYGVLGEPLNRWPLQSVRQQEGDAADQPAIGAQTARTVYSTSGKALVAVDEQNRVQARYHWGLQGERISKTLLSGDHGHTIYYLYQDGRTRPTVADTREQGQQLQAEVDASGRILRQYVYLDGQVVASIDTQTPGSAWSRLQASLWSWFGRVPDAQAEVYAIHTDQRHAPVSVSNAQGQIVWRAQYSAFGQASIEHPQVQHEAQSTWSWIGEAYADAAPAYELNLRLPGQYWDAERNLHYNLQRDYDPQTGRYTTADPISMQAGLDLGQADRLAGGNVYGYVSGNPLTRMDEQGLYEQDVHYYMTFFLALAAGVDYNEARIIALAAQYIDDNPETKPFPSLPLAESSQRERLAKYHFTQDGHDPERMVHHPTAEERAAAINAGFPDPGDTTYEDARVYAERRINNPSNPQLILLDNAVGSAPTRCGQLQFFGEYLHAFEDTFGHRSKDNTPISVNLGLGHAVYGHEPDKTYNDTVWVSPYPGAVGTWDLREKRTLEMEKEVYETMSRFAKGGPKIAWSDLVGDLKIYNAIKEEGNEAAKKFAKLTEMANAAGIKASSGDAIDFKAGGAEHYNETSKEQQNNRNQFLCDKDGKRLNQADYEGTILPSKDTPCTIK